MLGPTEKRKLYWLCQCSGWGLYAVINTYMPLPWASNFGLVTHSLRRLRSQSLRSLGPRLSPQANRSRQASPSSNKTKPRLGRQLHPPLLPAIRHHPPLILKSLQSLEDRLPKHLFFRANRKHLINLNHIENVALNPADNLVATLKGNHEVELSRRQSNFFKSRLIL